jgi:hypothetical protein
MNASYFGFDSFYNKLTPQPYEQFRVSWSLRQPFLRELMGERYVLCAPESKPLDQSAKPRFGIDGYTLFENPIYMDRVSLIHSLAGTYTDEADLLRGIGRGFDFKHRVYLAKDDAIKLGGVLSAEIPAAAQLAKEKIVIRRESTNHISIGVTARLPAVVVLNQWFTPAWKAKVNGRSLPIFRANQWQVGVPVEAGQNVVEFRYRPTLCRILLILNLATWLILALLGLGLAGWKIRMARKNLRTT